MYQVHLRQRSSQENWSYHSDVSVHRDSRAQLVIEVLAVQIKHPTYANARLFPWLKKLGAKVQQ
jgi:hypothetical protein